MSTKDKWCLSEPNKDTIRILFSSDNHLGYNEKDPVRSEDSFLAFEEVLKKCGKFKARELLPPYLFVCRVAFVNDSNFSILQADMLLLGGDLFHDNKPSRKAMVKAMQLLRKYCMGDAPVSLVPIDVSAMAAGSLK
jgi:double-strand break repair protein MRE11